MYINKVHNTGCQDGSQPVNCKVNPCQFDSCPAVAGATCVADYCGRCNAQWILNGQEVTDQCQGKAFHLYKKALKCVSLQVPVLEVVLL